VLRGGRERDREGFGELAHRPLAAREVAQHPAAGGVAEGVKDRIQLLRSIFNHVVEYKVMPSNSQPIG
jgi:hypothetical protein